jgi:hypothetical protein
MEARLVKFGQIEVEGKRYTYDVVIDGGKCGNGRKDLPSNSVKSSATRRFRPGKKFPGEASGSLSGPCPRGASGNGRSSSKGETARYRSHCGTHTSEVCQLLEEVKKGQAYAILHCTC